MTFSKNKPLIPLLLLALAIVMPLIFKHPYLMRVVIMIFYFGVTAYGWDVIGGYAGQVSVGQGMFFAVGAYSVALGYLVSNLTPVVGALIGVIIAMLLALGIGSVVLRLRGPYFTLSTIAACEVVRILLLHFKEATGGPEGLVIPYNGYNLYALHFANDLPYYYIALGLLLVAMYTCYRVSRSKLGYQLAAIRNDEDAAKSVGINLVKSKVKAFMISAAITSLAGAFYVTYDHYIDPFSTCSNEMSVKILLIAVLGGRRSLWGPLIGSLLIIPLMELTNAYLASVRPGAAMLIYAMVLVAVVLYAPDGIASVFKSAGKEQKGDDKLAAN